MRICFFVKKIIDDIYYLTGGLELENTYYTFEKIILG